MDRQAGSRLFIGALTAILAAAPMPAAGPAASAAAEPVTALVFEPSGADWITGGYARTLTNPELTYPSTGTATRVSVHVADTDPTGRFPGTGTWDWTFATGADVAIVPGTYETVSASSTQATSELSGMGRGCDESGVVTIAEYAFDPGTSAVTLLAATFHLRCGQDTIHGEVRVSSTLPWVTSAVVPGAVDFGSDPIGGTAIERTTDVLATGTAPLVVSAIEITGADADAFTLTAETCTGSEVQPGGSCAITVAFDAVAGVDNRAALTVTTNALQPTRSIALTGTPEPPLVADPPRLDFGGVGELNSRTLATTITWRGDGSLVIGGLVFDSVSAEPATDFAVTDETCTGAPVPSGSGCAIEVTFAPTAQIHRLAWLMLLDPGGAAIGGVPLDGWGDPYRPPMAFGTAGASSPGYTWNHGSALARTARSGGEYLHLVTMTDRVNGKRVRNAGPYLAVQYQRSGDGRTWTAPRRINPAKRHGYWASTAATGNRVFVAWVQSAEVIDAAGTARRVVYLRRNTGGGSAASWQPVQRISPLSGRVDMPTVAASGKRVLIAWTDGATGAIRVARSTDGGKTFATTSVGTTTRKNRLGRSGLPKVAISGSTAIVAWISDGAASPVKARVSTNGGKTWGSTTTILNATDYVHAVAAGSGRAIVAASAGGILTRAWKGAWEAQARRPVETMFGLEANPAIVLRGESTIAMAWSGCSSQYRGDCDRLSGGTRYDVVWAESPDNGAHWSGAIIVAQTSDGAPQLLHETPSITWGTRRAATWNASSAVATGATFTGRTSYRLYARVAAAVAVTSAGLHAATEATQTPSPGERTSSCRALGDGGTSPAISVRNPFGC